MPRISGILSVLVLILLMPAYTARAARLQAYLPVSVTVVSHCTCARGGQHRWRDTRETRTLDTRTSIVVCEEAPYVVVMNWDRRVCSLGACPQLHTSTQGPDSEYPLVTLVF